LLHAPFGGINGSVVFASSSGMNSSIICFGTAKIEKKGSQFQTIFT
jgi:hypothetical protein